MRRVVWWLAAVALLLAAPGSVDAAPGLVGREVVLGDARATVWLWPGIFRPTSVMVQLDDGSGSAPTDIVRVDLQFAMAAMNHGATGIMLKESEPGVFVASEYLLSMEGAWWMALRVERSDGQVVASRVPFDVAPERGGVSSLLYARPDPGVQVVDVVVHPHGIIPSQVAVSAGHPVRVALMYVDEPVCGQVVRADDPATEVAVSIDGLAELSFVPSADGELALACTASGLALSSVGAAAPAS